MALSGQRHPLHVCPSHDPKIKSNPIKIVQLKIKINDIQNIIYENME